MACALVHSHFVKRSPSIPWLVATIALAAFGRGLPAQGPSLAPIDLRIQRFDGRSGPVVVSNAIPLPPGAVRPDQVNRLRLTVEGAEVQRNTQALAGLHRDGTLRSVLLQFMFDVPPSGWKSGTISLGSPVTTTGFREPEGFDRGVADAVALPTDVAYLVGTGINGTTVSVSDSRAEGPAFAAYEANFSKWSDFHWKLDGENWSGANYYDRALIYYAFWVRSANPVYFRRATQIARNYRRNYLEANQYGTSPHWSQPEGVAQHYLLTGDEASRFAVARIAEQLQGGYPFADTLNTPWMESRIQARAIQALLTAWRLNAVGPKAIKLDQRLTRVVERSMSVQRPDGSMGWPATCGQSLNFMLGLLNDQLISVHTHFKPDTAILRFVKRSTDYLWSTQWVDAQQSFKYLSGRCAKNAQGEDVGGAVPSPDLNLLFVTSFGWLYQQTGDVKYRQWGDRVFAGGVKGAYLQGSKQFNESYTSSYRYLALRRPPT